MRLTRLTESEDFYDADAQRASGKSFRVALVDNSSPATSMGDFARWDERTKGENGILLLSNVRSVGKAMEFSNGEMSRKQLVELCESGRFSGQKDFMLGYAEVKAGKYQVYRLEED